MAMINRLMFINEPMNGLKAFRVVVAVAWQGFTHPPPPDLFLGYRSSIKLLKSLPIIGNPLKPASQQPAASSLPGLFIFPHQKLDFHIIQFLDVRC